ncbi:MAG: hypothetical protein A2X86_15885 [Bdellovibrionales bacterium GWA2_49_15]|nr:MAG: hypothetical protein A2X86_15885 [Bdellovibrionales bacterium GWA2_49_15]HAZ12418.1 hypothetical protein [Bdellovibrionales bacterium]
MHQDSSNNQNILLVQSVQACIAAELALALKLFSPKHFFHEILNYSVCPPGKLFRPLLVWGVASDLAKRGLTPNDLTSSTARNILTLSLALEFHHAYSLVHDDLPSMDNDRYRRGKLATHAQYGEWQAILAGDGLLNLSYYCLSKIKSPNLQTLLAIMGHSLGPKGLVFGQVMDLALDASKAHSVNAQDKSQDVDTILKIHELKTARLFQVALVGSFLLMTKAPQSLWSPGWRPYWKLGRSLGIVFQLLDDLAELCEGAPQAHEDEVNPWPHHYHFLCKVIKQELGVIIKSSQTFDMQNLQMVWHPYFASFIKTIEANQEKLFGALTKTQSLKKSDLKILMGALQGLDLKQ